jgi:hypothetical protein
VLLLDDPSPHQTPNNTFILFNKKAAAATGGCDDLTDPTIEEAFLLLLLSIMTHALNIIYYISLCHFWLPDTVKCPVFVLNSFYNSLATNIKYCMIV